MGTGLHAVSLGLTLLLGVLMLVVPRRWALLPMLVAAVFIPPDQRIIVATLDFPMMRIMILFASTRVLFRGEGRTLRLNWMDRGMVAFVLTLCVTASLLYDNTSVVVNRLGSSFDLLGMYFYCRVALRSWEDMRTAVLAAIACMAVFAVFMTIESATGRNLFATIGGVPERTVIRDGRLRCQGAFSHPILAGLFGAAWVPLFIALWWQKQRELAVLGTAFGTWVMILSASSTPALGYVAGLLAMALWPLRRSMSLIRWSLWVTIVVLHLVRDKPVWHLLARINVVGGSTGWHRYQVIDAAIAHFDEWWLLGTGEITHWRVHWNDITNQYVAAAINGGGVGMLLFIFVIVLGFSGIGKAVRSRAVTPGQARFAWALGSVLFLYTSSFFAVTLFGQMTYIWYLHLAMVCSAIEASQRAGRARVAAGMQARVLPPSPIRNPGPSGVSGA